MWQSSLCGADLGQGVRRTWGKVLLSVYHMIVSKVPRSRIRRFGRRQLALTMLPRVKPGFCRAPLCQRTFKGARGLSIHHSHSAPCIAWYKAQRGDLSRSPSEAVNEPDAPSSPLPWTSISCPPLVSSAPRRNRPVTIEEIDSDDGLGVDDCFSETSDDGPSATKSYTEFHPTAGKTFGKGRTIMQEIDDDSTPETKANIFHPFISRQDFEMAAWLSQSNVTMSQIDDFLKLPYVCSTSPGHPDLC